MREVSRGVPLNVSLWSSLTDLSNRSEDLTEEAGWKDRCQGGRRGYWQVYHKFFNLVCYSGCKLAQALSPHRRNVLALGTRDVMMALCKLGSWGSSLLTAKSQAFSGICPSWESPSVLWEHWHAGPQTCQGLCAFFCDCLQGSSPPLRVEKCVILQGQLRCPVPRSLLLAASLTLRHLCPVLSHLGQHLSACWAHFIKMGIGEVCSFTETSASRKQRPFLICRIIWVYVTPTMTAINENIIITSY